MEYVIVYPRIVGNSGINDVLLIEKKRPDWQKGRLNLVGGKIESGETPEQAAERELYEEAGMTSCSPLQVMGIIVGEWGTVFCVKVPILKKTKPQPRLSEDEIVDWISWDVIKSDPRLLPNLHIIIPLMQSGCTDWVMYDGGPHFSGDVSSYWRHTMSITMVKG